MLRSEIDKAVDAASGQKRKAEDSWCLAEPEVVPAWTGEETGVKVQALEEEVAHLVKQVHGLQVLSMVHVQQISALEEGKKEKKKKSAYQRFHAVAHPKMSALVADQHDTTTWGDG